MQYRLKCPCGYESAPVPFGSDAWSPDYNVPVVVENDEVLRHVVIVKQEEESEEQFGDRLDSAIAAEIADSYGPAATRMTPLAIRGDQIVQCPRCKVEQAKFEFAGF